MTLSPSRTDLVLTPPAGLPARRGHRRAPARYAFLVGALTRCLLYLGPLAVVVAAARPAGRVAWPVPLVVALLGWSAALALTSLGAAVARTAGPAAAARMVAGGFAVAGGVWAAFVWVAPAAWLGPSRIMAGVLGAGVLTALATVTAALVTGAEFAVIRWSLPCWLLGGTGAAAVLGAGPAAAVPVGTLLPAAVVVAAVRAYRPVIGRSVPDRSPLTRADRRRCAGYLVVGGAQVAAVALLWRAGSAAPVLLGVPLLLSVPLREALTGWDRQAAGRRGHGTAVGTVCALVPSLAFGAALGAAGSQVHTARTDVLILAAAVLLGGVLAATGLLAARGRTALAAICAAAAPAGVVLVPLLGGPADALTTAVAVFAAAHLLGLLAVARTAADPRRTP